MCALALHQNGYGDATRSTGTPRDIEYQLFGRVTGRLHKALAADAGFPQLAEALSENLSLWRTIALEVADVRNELPKHLRAQLFYMFEFTSAHTQKVLRREADATVLIDINRTIMRGLRPLAAEKASDECPASS